MNRLESEISNGVKGALSILDNEYISTALSLFLVLYAGMAAPKLPRNIAKLFENTMFRIVVFFLIAYVARKNASVAAIAAVGLMVSLQTLNRYNVNDMLKSLLNGQVGRSEVMGQEIMPASMPASMPPSTMEMPFDEHEVIMEAESLDDVGCAGGRCGMTDSINAYKSRNSKSEVGGFDNSASEYASVN